MSKLKLEFFKKYSSEQLPYPQLFKTLNLVSIKNKLITLLVLRNYSNESKILYKLIRNEKRISRSTSSKPEQES